LNIQTPEHRLYGRCSTRSLYVQIRTSGLYYQKLFCL